jgi:DNA-binding NtrC family response regulator
MAATVMVVDDDPKMQRLLTGLIQTLGYTACGATTGEEAIAHYKERRPALVLLDLLLPDMDGLQALKSLKGMDPLCRVVIMSGYNTIHSAVQATKLGAENCLTKPVPLDELEILLQSVQQGSEPESLEPVEGLLGKSRAMQDVYRMIRKLAPKKTTVLIRGESGTGKEIVARAIHALGSSDQKPFISVNCANIPVNLLETELFGYERGAFTDAKEQKKGLLELADGGTFFLDEIGLMPPDLQSKLLTMLETRQFRRMGGTQQIEVSVRFLAATNEDLEEAVQQGRFREDLYYRLNVVPIHLPPLREREDDILLLADHFLQEAVAFHKTSSRRFSDNARKLLQSYVWPGNVRELKNVIERAVLLSEGEVIRVEELAIDRRLKRRLAVLVNAEGQVSIDFPKQGISLEAIEKQVIRAALQHTAGNISKAATLLHISRDILRYRIEKYGPEEP